jgi:hypothetical protein
MLGVVSKLVRQLGAKPKILYYLRDFPDFRLYSRFDLNLIDPDQMERFQNLPTDFTLSKELISFSRGNPEVLQRTKARLCGSYTPPIDPQSQPSVAQLINSRLSDFVAARF